MNIQEAKAQIQNALTAYFTKDQFGNYVIPIEQQRPVFLIGPPGLGKTAIIEQIAAELGVGLVSYSMTHHTRQSALGLPFIVEKVYGGKSYHVSEYTMSEIIASVYDLMEETGLQEGILFLDEINCVSETLAPSMLQFLQYKVFGQHRVPDGWIVVTAGNPPEYNSSVRDFDIVTLDRLKRIDVEPNFNVWKKYAYQRNVHPAVLTYLEIKKKNFYQIETTVDGKQFVTARGWSDLSDMIHLYEQHDIAVNESLVKQYLQNRKIAKDFSIYYDLFNKYRSDYQVDKILAGKADETIKHRAKEAGFDERLSLIGLLISRITESLTDVCVTESTLTQLMAQLKEISQRLIVCSTDASTLLNEQITQDRKCLEKGRLSSAMSREEQQTAEQVITILEEWMALISAERPRNIKSAFSALKADFDKRTKALRTVAKEAGDQLSHGFLFCEEVFNEGQEMLTLMTELTVNPHSAHFIGRYGCAEYDKHSGELTLYKRKMDMIHRLEEIDWDLAEAPTQPNA